MIFLLIHTVLSLRVDENKQISRIAFGSCANQFRMRNPAIFYSIANWNPDIFLWLGDSIYADKFSFPFRFHGNDLSTWEKMYSDFKKDEEYANLINKTMITGVWDDHDYGINDGNKYYPLKNEAKKLFSDFLDDGSIRNHEGLYHSFSFPNLKIILLDIRWFRDDKKDLNGDSIGEEQWTWLESELKTQEKIKIIGNGLQANTEDRFGPAERWHKKSVEKLLNLVELYPGIVLLSGDVHSGEIMKIPCKKHVLYEITSSGLTHAIYTTGGFFTKVFIELFHTYTFNVGPKTLKKNFGTIEINWKEEWIEFALRNSFGQSVNSHKIQIFELFEENSPPALCLQDPVYRNRTHFYSVLLIFYVPFVLYSLSLIIYLRKLSKSY